MSKEDLIERTNGESPVKNITMLPGNSSGNEEE